MTEKVKGAGVPGDAIGRAHAIFTRALGLEGEAREEMIHAECAGDADVLKRVRRLLKAAERNTDFLEAPALASRENRTEWAAAAMPDAVGTYLVVGVLGVGGMATVYEAVQENPNRRVAIKVMHQAMSRTDALLRFRLEAQTLARLRHPGIAQIYEAGTAQLGQDLPSPFFAMELVPDALPITEYAKRKQLSLRERLEMFASVCDAVLHGHQNGVIHRDIKAANVLVGPDGRAKVIDFGIARGIDPGESSVTIASDGRKLIGTLNSMSPEQCVDPAGIDVRSDVYSLGVLLYELVTGKLPHDLSRCSIPQAVREITEGSVASAGTNCPEAKGDLEAVVAMAMEKDRDRRYSSAGELAADVRRFRNNQPVLARRSGTLEQIRKFARRNPPLAAAIATAVALLVLGVIVSTGFAYSAARARDAALKRERDLEVVTEFQESLLRELDVKSMGNRLQEMISSQLRAKANSKDKAEDRDWEQAIAGLNFTTIAVDSLNQSVLQRYAKSINERFSEQPELRARILHRVAGTMNVLGLHTEGLPVVSEALQLRCETLGEDHEDTLQSRHLLGLLLSTLGKFDEAEKELKETYERRQRVLGKEHPATLSSASSLAGVYRRLDKLPEAESVWTDTLARQRRVLGDDDANTLRTLNNIGVLYAVLGKFDQAEACWRELLERRKRLLGAEHPAYRSSLGNLGSLLQRQGKYKDAEPLLRESLASDRKNLGDAHSTTLTSMAMLASLLRDTGDFDEAEALQRECVQGRMTVLGADHPATVASQSLLGAILHARGETETGERLLRESVDTLTKTLGESHIETLEALELLRDAVRAERRTDDALALSTKLNRLLPKDTEPIIAGKAESVQGALLAEAGRNAEALPALENGYAVLNKSVGPKHPETRAAAARLAEYYSKVSGKNAGAENEKQIAKWRGLADGAKP